MKNKPGHIDFTTLIIKELSGEISADERTILHEWVAADKANEQEYHEFRKLWDEMDKVQGATSAEVDAEWKRLERLIDAEEEEYEKFSWSFGGFMKVAASLILLIAAGIGVYYVLNSNVASYQAVANIREVKLPEGTIVALNVDSKIKVPKKFTDDIRKVELTGEAFFQVARDTVHPFVVKAGDAVIQVLGTAFNVRAYRDEDKVEVTVEHGKVAVFHENKPGDRVILVKGKKAVLRKSTGEIIAQDNDNINFRAWQTRKMIFEDTPMTDVARIVSEVYHIDIRLEDSRTANCPLTTVFDNQSLETVLNVISSTLGLEVKKKGDIIILSGSGC